MQNLPLNVIDNKIILSSVLFAIMVHASLIPLSDLIKIKQIEEIEPKIVLELINDIKDNTPVRNNIIAPEIVKPEKIPTPSNITPPKEIQLQPIQNTTIPIDIAEDVIIPENLKPLTNNKIDIPQKITKINSEASINKLPEIIKPEKIILNNKPVKTLDKPTIIVDSKISQPQIIDNNFISQNINLPEKPIIQKDITNDVNKDVTKKAELENDELSVNEINTLEKYKSNIRTIIQSFAINNYPKKDLRRKNEGIVQIIFKLKDDGNIEYIETGPDTTANKSLVKAAIDSVKKSAPFEKIKLLKKSNEFEINIIYKIN